MSEYFKRVIKVRTHNTTWTNDKLHIEFEVPFDDDHEPNRSTIRIYNLSHDSRAKFKRGNRLVLNAGYEGDVGVVLDGEITRVRSEKVGPDRTTIIKVLDTHGVTSKKTIKKTYKQKTNTSTIIRDLAHAIGLKLKVLDLPKDKVQKKGYNVTGNVLDTIERLADDCGASFYFSKGYLYIRDIRKGDNTKFTLTSSTGLIGSPDIFEKSYHGKTVKGFRVDALLQHKVSTASILTLKCQTVVGKFRVISGKHVANKSDFQTQFDCISSK
ncbi:hypothetical protein [Rummeliibacillus sp. TYF-LIM-RU47]|uniref:phage protein n=1 Tax=Rummeliibacillus sp. TYF-LIM-RU47 TaxID=2608406 RepID=UPI00123B7C43|nr:hypothetical protein [Rummeliibacillus sp. TYF-LIM-RU47]